MSKTSIPALASIPSAMKLETETLFPEIKRPELEAEQNYPSIVEFE